MLRKLIKYEMKSSARYLLPLYLSVLVLAILNRLSAIWLNQSSGASTFETILMVFYVLLVISLFVITAVGILLRFYHNLLGQEGYLMFTLPVSASANLMAKLLSAIFWTIASIVVFFLSLLLLTLTSPQLLDIPNLILHFFDSANEQTSFIIAIFLEICLLLLLSLASFILLCYLSMAIGQLANRQKLLLSVAAFLGLQFLGNTLTILFISSNFTWIINADSLLSWFASLSQQTVAHITLLGASLGTLIVCAILYIPCWLLLKNKLNLS